MNTYQITDSGRKYVHLWHEVNDALVKLLSFDSYDDPEVEAIIDRMFDSWGFSILMLFNELGAEGSFTDEDVELVFPPEGDVGGRVVQEAIKRGLLESSDYRPFVEYDQ